MKERVENFLSECKRQNINILVTETWRSKPRQLWLYASGRTLPSGMERAYLGYDDINIYSNPIEKQVTWTLDSKHLTGEAIDITFITQYGISYIGNWDQVLDIAERFGLSSLYRKVGEDKPHLEFDPNWNPLDLGLIKELEANYRDAAVKVNVALKELNKVRKLLADAKGVDFEEHKII